jgi:hypothetical protein
VGKDSKRTSIRFIALIISLVVQGLYAPRAAASGLSETELRAVISTWQKVKMITNGVDVIPDEVRLRALNLPISKVQGLTYAETVEVIELIYVTSKKTILPEFGRLPGPEKMRNPFLRDNSERVDVPVLPPDPLWLVHGNSTYEFEIDRTKSILSMRKDGETVYVSMGEREDYLCGKGKTNVECRKTNGRWVITRVWVW